ncbi:hypothetical protein LTS18_002098, partial [Coniosporium uncinatum]
DWNDFANGGFVQHDATIRKDLATRQDQARQRHHMGKQQHDVETSGGMFDHNILPTKYTSNGSQPLKPRPMEHASTTVDRNGAARHIWCGTYAGSEATSFNPSSSMVPDPMHTPPPSSYSSTPAMTPVLTPAASQSENTATSGSQQTPRYSYLDEDIEEPTPTAGDFLSTPHVQLTHGSVRHDPEADLITFDDGSLI